MKVVNLFSVGLVNGVDFGLRSDGFDGWEVVFFFTALHFLPRFCFTHFFLFLFLSSSSRLKKKKKKTATIRSLVFDTYSRLIFLSFMDTNALLECDLYTPRAPCYLTIASLNLLHAYNHKGCLFPSPFLRLPPSPSPLKLLHFH